MPTFTLTEQEADGDFFQPRKPKRGDPWLVIERRLNDGGGTQVGTFTVRGTFMTNFEKKEAVIAFHATNKLTGRGDISTQAVIRLSDFDQPPVIIAIVGGTGEFRNARGTVSIDSPRFTFDVT